MALTIDQVISSLNDLIETLKDGEQGFQQAAENIHDKELEGLLMSYSRQRGDFASELQMQVVRLGGDPGRKGSVAGALHRGWINLRAAIAGGKPEDLLAECERGEEIAVSNYNDVLAKDLPEDVRAIVEQQNREIKDALDHVRSLQRNTLKYRMGGQSFNI